MGKSNQKLIVFVVIAIVLVSIGGYFLFMDNFSSQTIESSSNDSVNTGNNKLETTNNETLASYTIEDVAQHSTPEDCWLLIDGNIYDVTPFINSGSHPGGSEILKGCGIDSTDLYKKRPGSGTDHSKRAYDMLSNYLIGTLTE